MIKSIGKPVLFDWSLSKNYDAKTENGIEYVSLLYKSNYEYVRVVDTLDRMAPTVDGLYSGEGTTASYTIGRRSKTNSKSSR